MQSEKKDFLLLTGSKQSHDIANKCSKFYIVIFWGEIHKATQFWHTGMMALILIYVLNAAFFQGYFFK